MTGDSTVAETKPDDRRIRFRSELYAFASAFVWILMFGAGALVETAKYRLAIAPISFVSDASDTTMQRIVDVLPTQSNNTIATGKSEAANGQDNAGSSSANKREDHVKLALEWVRSLSPLQKTGYFFLCLICFTPVNMAFLSFTAGFMGGAFSNFYVRSLPAEEKGRISEQKPKRKRYLEEPPLSSAIRGLLAYLCILAGLFVVISDPFKDPSSAQYLKFAGLVSAVAFSLGYDPSRFEGLLSIIPLGEKPSDSGR